VEGGEGRGRRIGGRWERRGRGGEGKWRRGSRGVHEEVGVILVSK
jgi:hypothetical protein